MFNIALATAFTLRWNISINMDLPLIGSARFDRPYDETSVVGDESDDAAEHNNVQLVEAPSYFFETVVPIMLDVCEASGQGRSGIGLTVPAYQNASFWIEVNGQVSDQPIDIFWHHGRFQGFMQFSCAEGIPYFKTDNLPRVAIEKILHLFKKGEQHERSS